MEGPTPSAEQRRARSKPEQGNDVIKYLKNPPIQAYLILPLPAGFYSHEFCSCSDWCILIGGIGNGCQSSPFCSLAFWGDAAKWAR